MKERDVTALSFLFLAEALFTYSHNFHIFVIVIRREIPETKGNFVLLSVIAKSGKFHPKKG